MNLHLFALSHSSSARLLLSLCAFFFSTSALVRADVQQLKEARVSQVIRDVKILPNAAAPRPAKIKDSVRDGSAVRTGVESRAELTFTDQTLARLGANTIFSFNQGTRDLDLGGGAMLLRVPKNAGGAKINTAQVTAAITGTTIMLEYHADAYIKFIVLEGTGRIFRNNRLGESVLVHAGQMLIVNPKGKGLPDPVDVDIKRLVETSALLGDDFSPLESLNLINQEIQGQDELRAQQALLDTNLVIQGGGTSVTLVNNDTIDQRFAVTQTTTTTGTAGSTEPTPPPPSPTPPSTPTPTATPRPSVTPSPTATPKPSATPTPTATPSPTVTPTPTITPSPTPTPTATPPIATATYQGGKGNWSDPNRWNPGIVPNNGTNGVSYNVNFSSGTLTQDIAAGVIINQLFMSGGTLILAHPLTLNLGLQFSGGAILSGILNVAGNSSQSALLTVGQTIINNSGVYDLALNGNAFSGEATFSNSGTLTAHAANGGVTFNTLLNNAGTVSAAAGNLVLAGGGTNSGILSAAFGTILEIGSDFALTDGSQLTGAGVIQFDNNTSTTVAGTITNNGNLLLASTGNSANLVLSGDTTLGGSGVLTLQSAARITGSGTLTNAGNTINGATGEGGSLGDNSIGLVNQSGGLIDANFNGQTLTLDPSASAGMTNQGTLEASNGGNLLLSGNGGGTFTNTGTILASGGTVEVTGELTSSGTVNIGSGTMNIPAGGSYNQTGGTFILTGGTVNSTAAINFSGGLVDAYGVINASIGNPNINGGANIQPGLGGDGLTVNGRLLLLSASKLTFQLGGLTQGSQYGYLNVNGTVSLNGNLVVSFVNSFHANSDNVFTVLSAGSLAGSFLNVANGGRVTTSDNSGTFLVTYNGTTVVLSDFQPAEHLPTSSGGGTQSVALSKSTAHRPGQKAKNSEGEILPRKAPAPQVAAVFSPKTRQGSGPSIKRSRAWVVRVQNSNQILGLLDGAQTTGGKVTVNAPSQADAAKGPSRSNPPGPAVLDTTSREKHGLEANRAIGRHSISF